MERVRLQLRVCKIVAGSNLVAVLFTTRKAEDFVVNISNSRAKKSVVLVAVKSQSLYCFAKHGSAEKKWFRFEHLITYTVSIGSD